MKKEYLLLAQTYKPAKYLVSGWFLSEKLDGKRAYWDGGISRGCLATEVPWANTIKDKKPTIATGLWTRAGKIIYAPDWWLNDLPRIPLDGELWIGRGQFQTLTAITARHIPDAGWSDVKYVVFDSPGLAFYQDRTITVRDYDFNIKDAQKWIDCKVGVTYPNQNWNFEIIQTFLKGRITGKCVQLVNQIRLPFVHSDCINSIEEEMENIADLGGEGVMLRKPESFWTPIRSHYLLKYKPWKTGEGTVVGYRHAEEGKIQGLMGALILDLPGTNGKRLKISGFTDVERDYGGYAEYSMAKRFPGEEADIVVTHKRFPRGTVVKFKYRELSDDGIPKEARFLR